MSSFVNRQDNRIARMKNIDALSPELRALVHEYGWQIVDNFMRCGVVKPRQIRHLVELVLDDFSPTRGSFAKQGIRTPDNTIPEAPPEA